MFFIKSNVFGTGDLGDRAGGNDFGVEAFGNSTDGGHDTLNVNEHEVGNAGHDGQFLSGEVGGDGNTGTHENFVTCAADTGELNAFGAGRFGFVFHFGADINQSLAEERIMTMKDDVNFIGFQNAQVRFGYAGFGSTEENIGDIGGDMHTGIVTEGYSQAVKDNVNGVSVNTHMGGVKHGNNRTVDRSRIDAAIFEFLFSAFCDIRSKPTARFGSDVAKVVQCGESNFFSQSVDIFAFGADADVFSNSAEFGFVFYFEIAGFASGSSQ